MDPPLYQRLRWRAYDGDSPTSAADRAVMAQSLVYLYAGGATLGLASIVFFQLEPEASRVGLFATVAGGYVCAVIALIGFARLPSWAFQSLVACATALVALSLYFSGDPRNDNEMYFLLVTVYAFYFFSHAQAALQIAIVGMAYGASLVALESAGRAAPGRWLIAMGTLVVAGMTVSLLRRRVQQLVARLADAARIDPLTGLLNRRGFDRRFETELERARRGGDSLSLVVVDLDHFKALNDRLGHPAGDQALRRFSALLTARGRRGDSAARIGGEEFALLVPGAAAPGAAQVAERLRRDVADAFADHGAPLTMSAGIAACPQHGATLEELLGAADRALYQAKKLGRNRCAIGEPDTDRSVA